MSNLKRCKTARAAGFPFSPGCSGCIRENLLPNVTAGTYQRANKDFDVVAGGEKYPLIKPASCGKTEMSPNVERILSTPLKYGEPKTLLPTGDQERKDAPLARGLLDYFPRALVAVAALSKAANDKHNPGEPLHWSKDKSNDHADCLLRHLIERGTVDTDGQLHSVKVAWRALALLETELESLP